ncbi:hypothetical protein FQA39_LY15536 [Lamprigera yunnana]|nr:hypothetical protein FQA39_LY15536 [Lamprigera yunnana]
MNDKESRTSLHAASEKGHTDLAEFLLTHEGDMEARDNQGNTPLHVAAQHQQTNLIELLLDYGADPDVENAKGFTPLHIACSLGSRGILESLLQHGALLNMQNKMGNTPLHLACQANITDVVELLITKGADLNSLNSRLQTPIHIATELGHVDICKLLLSAGANIEQREQGGRTPLYIAARGSFTAIVDMIIKTARLDYPPYDEKSSPIKKEGSLKPVLNSARMKLRYSRDDGVRRWDSERLREVLFKLAYKQLGPGEWKRLANYWAFTEEQIRAIEHQYTGPSSFKEHGYRMMLIWAHGLAFDANPIRELYDSLTTIEKRTVAAPTESNRAIPFNVVRIQVLTLKTKDIIKSTVQIRQLVIMFSTDESTEEKKRKRSDERDSEDKGEASNRSKKTIRTPIKIQQKREDKLEVSQIRVEQSKYKKEIIELKNENGILKAESNPIIKDNDKSKIQLQEMNEGMEQVEKERRTENIVVQGLEINKNKQNELNKEMEKQYNIQKKTDIMKHKVKLTRYKDNKDYINNDMTRQERDIEKQIRLRAEEEMKQGKKVKSGYQKLYIDKQGHPMLYEKDLDASYKIKLDAQDAAGYAVNDDEMKRLNEIPKAIEEPEYWD